MPVGAVGFLERGRVDDADAVAEGAGPDAEVGVLGDVVGIPAAEAAQRLGAEVVRRAAQGDGKAQRVEAREHVVEPVRVFEREHAGEHVLVGVPIVECGLHAHEVLAAALEGDDGLLQLIGLGAVLGVIDHEEVAAGEEHADVARLRLRLRSALGDDEHRHRLGRVRGPRRLDGLGVVRLQEEQDLELLGRVVELGQVADEIGDDVRFLVDGNEDRVGRQLVVAEGGNLVVRYAVVVLVAGARHGDHELEQDAGEEGEAGERGGQHHRLAEGEHERHQDDAEGDAADGLLLAGQHLAARLVLGPAPQPKRRLVLHRGVVAPADALEDVPVGRGGQLDAGAQRCLDGPAPLGRGALARGHQHGAVLVATQRQPALARQPLAVDGREQTGIERLEGHVHEGHVPVGGQGLVQRPPLHEAGGDQDGAEAGARAALGGDGPRELIGGDEPSIHQRLPDRPFDHVLHLSPRSAVMTSLPVLHDAGSPPIAPGRRFGSVPPYAGARGATHGSQGW